MTPPGIESKGNQSLQYKSIQKHYAKLTGLLRINEATKSNLTDQLIAKGWLGPGSSATPNNLIDVVMEMIKHSATFYDDFIAVLQQCIGAQHIVDDLLGAA